MFGVTNLTFFQISFCRCFSSTALVCQYNRFKMEAARQCGTQCPSGGAGVVRQISLMKMTRRGWNWEGRTRILTFPTRCCFGRLLPARRDFCVCGSYVMLDNFVESQPRLTCCRLFRRNPPSCWRPMLEHIKRLLALLYNTHLSFDQLNWSQRPAWIY